jgi:hypothetical protein
MEEDPERLSANKKADRVGGTDCQTGRKSHRLTQREHHLSSNENGHRFSVLEALVEPPMVHGLGCRLVEAVDGVERLSYGHVAHGVVREDDGVQADRPLGSSRLPLGRVVGLHLHDDDGSEARCRRDGSTCVTS